MTSSNGLKSVVSKETTGTYHVERVHYAGQSEEYQDGDGFAICNKCGTEAGFIHCQNCEEGFSHHECGEDICCCANPENNIACDTCNGEGGWYYCNNCKKCLENEETIGGSNSSHG